MNADDWYADAVAKAAAAGYIEGYPDGTMRPDNPISREEAATIIMKINKLMENADAANKFTDASKLLWSKGAVGAVESAGIMIGYPDGSFQPKNYIKRGEAVSALDKSVTFIEPTETPLADGVIVPPTGGGGTPTPPVVQVSDINVTGASDVTTVVNGSTLQMSAAVTPTDATNKTVTWSVAPTTGAGAGTATIDATTGILTVERQTLVRSNCKLFSV